MSRLSFLATIALMLAAAAALPGTAATPAQEAYDIVLIGGTVMDPESGLNAVRNVGIRGDRIAIVTEEPLAGAETIDVAGLIVAPGFIDLHAHGQTYEANVFQAHDGVTTALELEGGVGDVAAFLEGRSGTSLLNFGASAAHEQLRIGAMPEYADALAQVGSGSIDEEGELQKLFALLGKAGYEPVDPARYGKIKALLLQNLQAGGLGIGLPHQYYPGASYDEIFRVFEMAAEWEMPIYTEAYPYTAASTGIESAIFDPGWQEKLRISYGDIQMQDTGERLTEETFNMYREKGGTVIIHMMKPEWIEQWMKAPWVMIASDGMPYAPGAHPRSAGTFTRVLGKYAREEEMLPLMEAISRMSFMPAERLERFAPGMSRKGRIQEGADADITVFDPGRVIDTATFEEDLSKAEGVQYVLVNGVLVVRNGATVGNVFPGRPVVGRLYSDS